MFFLSKLLPLFVLPLGVSSILLVVGLVKRRRRLIWAGVVVLLVSSNPMVGYFCIRSAEGWTQRRLIEGIPVADAVVVLSAGQTLAPGPARVSEWNDANRFFAGTELLLAGKAALLVFTGSVIAGAPGLRTEGDVLAAQARAQGVPADRIVVTPRVLNTADEAREVATVLRSRQVQNPRVVLVTAAFHMPRARQLFNQAGFVVEPFPVSFRSPAFRMTVFSFLPSVTSLRDTQTALRELYGRAFYWVKDAIASR